MSEDVSIGNFVRYCLIAFSLSVCDMWAHYFYFKDGFQVSPIYADAFV